MEEGAVGHNELDLHLGNAASGTGKPIKQSIGHDLTTGAVISAGSGSVSGLAEGCVSCNAVGYGQQCGEVGHRIRCRAQADVPLRGCAGCALGDGTGVTAVSGCFDCSDDGAVSGAVEGSGVGGEFFVDRAAVFRGEAGCFLYQQRRPPLVELASLHRSQGAWHLNQQSLCQAQQPGSSVRRLPPGQRHLRGHSLALLRGGNAGLRLRLTLGQIKGHSNPGLQTGDGGLHVLQHTQLVNQVTCNRACPDSVARVNRRERRDCNPALLLHLVHASTLPKGYDNF